MKPPSEREEYDDDLIKFVVANIRIVKEITQLFVSLVNSTPIYTLLIINCSYFAVLQTIP